MLEHAVVCSLEGNTIEVVIDRDCGEHCLHCSRDKRKHRIRVSNSKNLDVTTGDRVEIYLAPSKAILAGFFVFILPLLLFVLFYWTARTGFRSDNEAIPAAAGLCGIVAGFIINVLIKKLRKKEVLPDIVSVVSEKHRDEGNDTCNGIS
ncbi:MAG: SoxR reducing system RseC family protein [Spirochaetales bacterium]|nr:SoxR reducing system RseC family protein [Spirochaetales bacterium]